MIAVFTRFFRQLENGLLIVLLSTMIGLAAYQVISRNFFDSGLVWGDSFVRILVLWTTLLGAMVASRNDEHIRIDLLSSFLGQVSASKVRCVTSLFTASICFIFSWHSWELVYMDFTDGIIAFGSVPAWVCELILPIGGAIIGLRYLLHAVFPDYLASSPELL